VALSLGVCALIAVGVLIGPAAQARAAFSAPIGLSGVPSNAPNAVTDADGNGIAVWSQYDGAKWPVQVRQISAAGEPGPVKTLSAAAENAVYPQIAGDGDGGAIVVWSQPNGVTTPLKARSISSNGRLGKLKTLSRTPRTARPRIAGDGKGKVIAIWSQGRPGRIMARKISAAGRLGPVKTLSAAGKKPGGREVAMDAHGDAVVVWSQQGDANSRIKARRISAKGALGHVKTLSGSKHDAGFPEIASDRRGDAFAVWSQSSSRANHGHIKARRIAAKGALGHVKTLAAENGTPDIATGAGGDATVAWDFYGGGRTGIQARQISPGGALGRLQTLVGGHGVASEPHVGTDAAGNATVVWSIYRTSGTWPVQVRQISAAGALGARQTISSAGAEGRDPDIAVNREGKAFAVWQQFDGSYWRVWGAFGP
jgi:hypothetical protein